jgi:methylated-DNA-[protein]-cysteine S-methyltransferase
MYNLKELTMVALEQKPATQTLYWATVPGPIGACIVMATEDGVCWTGTPGTAADIGLAWVKRKLSIDRVVEGEKTGPLEQAVDELTRYLAGERLQFTCALDLHGTAFQVNVWQELLRIPYGETRSYLEIATAIGRPAAVRAVGAANGSNPIAIIVPCHRVIGSNGSLTGYGGGLPAKEWLLALEKAASNQL